MVAMFASCCAAGSSSATPRVHILTGTPPFVLRTLKLSPLASFTVYSAMNSSSLINTDGDRYLQRKQCFRCNNMPRFNPAVCRLVSIESHNVETCLCPQMQGVQVSAGFKCWQ